MNSPPSDKDQGSLFTNQPPYRQIVESADYGIGVIDRAGRYIFVNPKWCEMTGYSMPELLSLSVFEITVSDDIDTSKNSIRDLFSGKLPFYTLEKKFLRKNGQSFWGRLVATPIRDDQGEIRAINGLIADITELRDVLHRIKQFSSLHHAHAHINSLLLNIPEISEFVPEFTAALTRNTPFSRAEVFRFDAATRSFHPYLSTSGATEFAIRGINLEEIQSGQPHIRLLEKNTLPGVSCLGAFPVFKGTDFWGLLVLASPSEMVFEPQFEPLLKGFSETLSNTLAAHSLAALQRRTEQQLSQVRHIYRSLLEISSAAGEPSGDREFVSKVVRILGQIDQIALVTSFLLSPSGQWMEPVLLLAAGVSGIAFEKGVIPKFPLLSGEDAFSRHLPAFLNELGWPDWSREMGTSGSLFSRLIPLSRKGSVVGYLTVSAFNEKLFEKDFLSLIEEVRGIVSYGLDSREQERERDRLEKQQIRLSLIHQALHGLNQLVSKNPRDPELFVEAARLLVEVGKTSEAGFYTPDLDQARLNLIYFKGENELRGLFAHPFSFSTHPGDPDSSSLPVRAFLTGIPCYSNNLHEDYRVLGLDSLAAHDKNLSWTSAGAIPVSRGGSTVAVLSIVSKDRDFFDTEMQLLLEECGRTLSYALNARDLEESRLLAEKKLRKLAALHEALHRINRLIGSRPDPEHLYDETCRTLVTNGGLLDAAIFLYDSERNGLASKVIRGRSEQLGNASLSGMFFSTEPGHPDGLTGMVSAFLSGVPVVNQDFSENFSKPELKKLKEWGKQFDWKSGASFPIFANVQPSSPNTPLCSGRHIIGLLTVTSDETGFFQDSLVSLLEETARSISFALETHKEETARRESEEKLRKTSELYAALNGVNRLVNLRPDEQTLFNEACRIVTDIGMLYFSRILILDPENGSLSPVAVYSRNSSAIPFFRELSYGGPSETGTRFQQLSPQTCIREKRPVIHQNLVKELHNLGLGALSAKAIEFRLWSQGSFPISRNGKTAYVLSVFAEKVGFFDEDLVSLLDEISQTLSYALDNIDSERQRQMAEEHLRRSEEKYRLLMEEAGDGILILEADTTQVVDANKSATRFFGMRKSDLIGQRRSDLLPVSSQYRTPNDLQHPQTKPGIEHSQPRPIRYHLHANPDFLREVEVIESHLDWQGKTLVQLRLRDVTELHFYETKLQKLAQHDSLTGLLNRNAFYHQMEEVLRSASFESHYALFYIDLDNFKTVNDTFGHDVGDLLLIDVAEKLRRSVREDDLVARIGGDEFLVLLNDGISSGRVAEIAQSMIASLDPPFHCHGHAITIQASIGISCYPDNGTNPKDLIKNADLAMYRSKREGRNRFSFHDNPPLSGHPENSQS